MIPAFLDRSKIPHKPGVYIFKSSTNKILYVGKAIDLNNRVSSYFSCPQNLRTAALVEKIADLETIFVESELEALILEANLVKKYLPPFNIRLTDDKGYLYIGLTKENFSKVITLRKQDLKTVKKYWGPFPSSKTVRNTLKSLRKVFPWCSSTHSRSDFEFTLLEWKHRPCFYYHLGLCPGPCAGVISQQDYNKIINRFSKFMDGKEDEVVAEITEEMGNFSRQQKFEQAAAFKKTLDGIAYITQTNRIELYLENPNFLEEERKLALEALQKDLGLKKIPERIEGYDISNISGKEATGSMVVLSNGEIDKSQYRKFKIRISGRPNDVGMHQEMMRRRLSHPEWLLPDLIIIDGGRGQVRAIQFEILNFVFRKKIRDSEQFEIPLFGLAKKKEWLYPPEGEVIKLPKRSLSLKLLQKLRDEAHRFAVAYHRKLRTRGMIN